MRDICGILGVNRSSFYYQPREDPSEEVLRAEIEKLAGAYPRYGYRRITQLLLRQGYTVGTRRVARLMKDNNLLVSVKRAGQTTKSLQGDKPWSNLLENLEVSHQDQVWVADITYVRLKGRFIYVCLLMDVFTRIIKAWQISQHLNQSLTLKPLEEALCHSVPEIHHSDQGVQYLSKVYCHRKFRPLSKPRLCYNDNPFERRIPMAKRRKFTAKFKAKVVLEALSGESSQAELCRGTP